jgi:hypothetical protein
MRAANAPMGFCSPHVNRLKQYIEDRKCAEYETNTAAYGIVFVGLIFLGVGHSMPWSLGLPLMDDNVKRKSLPIYFGLIYKRLFLPSNFSI